MTRPGGLRGDMNVAIKCCIKSVDVFSDNPNLFSDLCMSLYHSHVELLRDLNLALWEDTEP